mmetsp:Transcript_38534/g.122452  ORF Transcript_38534/g.122452 Transcript_38534/m.122452 type:complete len:285 (+) Transcript_38534:31-885(+)
MLDHNALGLARGPGGEEDIDEVRALRLRGLALCRRIRGADHLLHADHPLQCSERLKPAADCLRADGDLRPALLQHVAQALVGPVEVQWNVRAAGAQDADHADDHGRAPRGHQGHQRVTANSAAAQRVRHLGSCGRQLRVGVRDACAVVDERHGLWCCSNGLVDERGDGAVRRPVAAALGAIAGAAVGVAPSTHVRHLSQVQADRKLCGRLPHERQLADRCVRGQGHLVDERGQVRKHPLRCLRREAAAHVPQLQSHWPLASQWPARAHEQQGWKRAARGDGTAP